MGWGCFLMKRILVVGCGNVGLAAAKALEEAKDFALFGFLRQKEETVPGFSDKPVWTNAEGIEPKPDGVVLAVPSRKTEKLAKKFLSMGIYTVDACDLHGDLPRIRQVLKTAAEKTETVAVTGAGWDPGLDSALRALFLAAAPEGTTDTTFGPGVSMGHTAAVKAVSGVSDALAFTLPGGKGKQKREVYVKIEKATDEKRVEHAILTDPYFEHDKTKVHFKDDLSAIRTSRHRVRIDRIGTSAGQTGQKLFFSMAVDNPALTGQLLVSAMRSAFHQKPGCYYFSELPPASFLLDESSLLDAL